MAKRIRFAHLAASSVTAVVASSQVAAVVAPSGRTAVAAHRAVELTPVEADPSRSYPQDHFRSSRLDP